jgi:flagellar basal body-associated protein FliL
MVIKVYAVGQPSFFNTNNEVTKAISVSQPAYLLPLIIAVVVIAIGILAYAYYSLSRRKKEGGKEEKQIRKLK